MSSQGYPEQDYLFYLELLPRKILVQNLILFVANEAGYLDAINAYIQRSNQKAKTDEQRVILLQNTESKKIIPNNYHDHCAAIVDEKLKNYTDLKSMGDNAVLIDLKTLNYIFINLDRAQRTILQERYEANRSVKTRWKVAKRFIDTIIATPAIKNEPIETLANRVLGDDLLKQASDENHLVFPAKFYCNAYNPEGSDELFEPIIIITNNWKNPSVYKGSDKPHFCNLSECKAKHRFKDIGSTSVIIFPKKSVYFFLGTYEQSATESLLINKIEQQRYQQSRTAAHHIYQMLLAEGSAFRQIMNTKKDREHLLSARTAADTPLSCVTDPDTTGPMPKGHMLTPSLHTVPPPFVDETPLITLSPTPDSTALPPHAPAAVSIAPIPAEPAYRRASPPTLTSFHTATALPGSGGLAGAPLMSAGDGRSCEPAHSRSTAPALPTATTTVIPPMTADHGESLGPTVTDRRASTPTLTPSHPAITLPRAGGFAGDPLMSAGDGGSSEPAHSTSTASALPTMATPVIPPMTADHGESLGPTATDRRASTPTLPPSRTATALPWLGGFAATPLMRAADGGSSEPDHITPPALLTMNPPEPPGSAMMADHDESLRTTDKSASTPASPRPAIPTPESSLVLLGAPQMPAGDDGSSEPAHRTATVSAPPSMAAPEPIRQIVIPLMPADAGEQTAPAVTPPLPGIAGLHMSTEHHGASEPADRQSTGQPASTGDEPEPLVTEPRVTPPPSPRPATDGRASGSADTQPPTTAYYGPLAVALIPRPRPRPGPNPRRHQIFTNSFEIFRNTLNSVLGSLSSGKFKLRTSERHKEMNTLHEMNRQIDITAVKMFGIGASRFPDVYAIKSSSSSESTDNEEAPNSPPEPQPTLMSEEQGTTTGTLADQLGYTNYLFPRRGIAAITSMNKTTGFLTSTLLVFTSTITEELINELKLSQGQFEISDKPAYRFLINIKLIIYGLDYNKKERGESKHRRNPDNKKMITEGFHAEYNTTYDYIYKNFMTLFCSRVMQLRSNNKNLTSIASRLHHPMSLLVSTLVEPERKRRERRGLPFPTWSVSKATESPELFTIEPCDVGKLYFAFLESFSIWKSTKSKEYKIKLESKINLNLENLMFIRTNDRMSDQQTVDASSSTQKTIEFTSSLPSDIAYSSIPTITLPGFNKTPAQYSNAGMSLQDELDHLLNDYTDDPSSFKLQKKHLKGAAVKDSVIAKLRQHKLLDNKNCKITNARKKVVIKAYTKHLKLLTINLPSPALPVDDQDNDYQEYLQTLDPTGLSYMTKRKKTFVFGKRTAQTLFSGTETITVRIEDLPTKKLKSVVFNIKAIIYAEGQLDKVKNYHVNNMNHTVLIKKMDKNFNSSWWYYNNDWSENLGDISFEEADERASNSAHNERDNKCYPEFIVLEKDYSTNSNAHHSGSSNTAARTTKILTSKDLSHEDLINWFLDRYPDSFEGDKNSQCLKIATSQHLSFLKDLYDDRFFPKTTRQAIREKLSDENIEYSTSIHMNDGITAVCNLIHEAEEYKDLPTRIPTVIGGTENIFYAHFPFGLATQSQAKDVKKHLIKILRAYLSNTESRELFLELYLSRMQLKELIDFPLEPNNIEKEFEEIKKISDALLTSNPNINIGLLPFLARHHKTHTGILDDELGLVRYHCDDHGFYKEAVSPLYQFFDNHPNGTVLMYNEVTKEIKRIENK